MLLLTDLSVKAWLEDVHLLVQQGRGGVPEVVIWEREDHGESLERDLDVDAGLEDRLSHGPDGLGGRVGDLVLRGGGPGSGLGREDGVPP